MLKPSHLLAHFRGEASSSWAVLAALIIISCAYGFQWRFQDEALIDYFRLWSIIFLIGLVAITLAVSRSGGKPRSREFPLELGLAASGGMLVMTAYFYSYKLPFNQPVLYAVASVLVAGLAGKLLGARWQIGFLALSGLALYVAMVWHFPHDHGANMIEVTEAAARRWQEGGHPYIGSYAPISGYPFGYLPGTLLPYALTTWLGLDSRVVNLACLVGIALIFWFIVQPAAERPHLVGITILPFAFSPPVAQMVVHGHIWPYWLFLVACFASLLRDRTVIATVFFGLALATRQPSVLLLLPMLAFVVSRYGTLAGLGYAALAVVVFSALVLPFALPMGREFWIQTYYTPGFNKDPAFMFEQLGGFGFLKSFSVGSAGKAIQMLVVLFASAWIARCARTAGTARCVALAGVTYLWFVFFNDYVVRYVYLPGILMIMLAFVASTDSQRVSPLTEGGSGE